MPITPDGAVANSIQEFIDIVERLQSHFGISHPGEIWYRGHANASWELRPKLLRPEYGATEEGAMVEKFRARAVSRHAHCPQDDGDVHWFTLMQHYGLPTRFLDWSEAALVAAYFAVSDSATTGPGAVWALVAGGLNGFQDLGYRIYTLGHPSTRWLLNQTVVERQSIDLTIAIGAPEKDVRLMVQQAAFTIHGSDRPLEQMDRASHFLLKITIPEYAKATMRETLAMLGIRRATLFPDLDNLSREIADTHRAIVATRSGNATQGNP